MSPQARLGPAGMGAGHGDLSVWRNEEVGALYSSPAAALSPSSRRSIFTSATPPLAAIT
jgi:hypothetical protein